MPEKKFPFQLGSDPEFSFVMQERRVNACELLTMNFANKKEFKKRDNGYDCKGGQIGWDGCSATAELRPKPSNSVTEITTNFKSMLNEIHQNLPTFDLSVISTYAPVGGHIHFQITQELNQSKTKIQMLHKKISSFFLPIMISENKINLRLRTRGHDYGTLTDFHDNNVYTKADGTKEYTYEFRTPSAEWLTTEKICRATFAYMGVVYNEILNKPKNFAKYMGIVYKNNDQATSLHQLIITDYIGITKTLFEQIKKAVRTFEMYPDFKEEIEYILNPKKVMADKKKANYNIVEGWKLTEVKKEKKPSIKELLNDKKFKELAATFNLDRMANLMNISFNDDKNVESFVKALTERATAFSWKLKNSYFVFGMKKGLETQIVFDQNEKIILGKEIIKTKEDQSALKELIQRISAKFLKNQQKQINLITGEVEKSNVIIIGLPYQMRVDNKFKDFIKLVHELEEGKLKAEQISSAYKNLINDTDNEDKDKGEVYKYVYGIEETEETQKKEIPYDENSQGARIAQDNREHIINEVIEDEVNNEVTVEELINTSVDEIVESTMNTITEIGHMPNPFSPPMFSNDTASFR